MVVMDLIPYSYNEALGVPLSGCLERMWPIDSAVCADRFASSTIYAGFVLARRRS